MNNFDAGEVIPKALDFIEKSKDAENPFFTWLNASRMHLYTRVEEEWLRKVERTTSEQDYRGAGILQHDHNVGLVLDTIGKLALDENTIIVDSTDTCLCPACGTPKIIARVSTRSNAKLFNFETTHRRQCSFGEAHTDNAKFDRIDYSGGVRYDLLS